MYTLGPIFTVLLQTLMQTVGFYFMLILILRKMKWNINSTEKKCFIFFEYLETGKYKR